MLFHNINLWEPLKTGVKSKNGQSVPDSRKADEVRLYALRGGLTTKMARTAHFRSHEVFRGDLIFELAVLSSNAIAYDDMLVVVNIDTAIKTETKSFIIYNTSSLF